MVKNKIDVAKHEISKWPPMDHFFFFFSKDVKILCFPCCDVQVEI
jgi:hypothetical protein